MEGETLASHAGQYGPRTFAVKEDTLTYRHQEASVAWDLAPISTSRFHLDGDLKFEFLSDEHGATSAVTISYRDGRPQVTIDRTSAGS